MKKLFLFRFSVAAFFCLLCVLPALAANIKIKGAVKKGNLWLIPVDAEKPLDGRTIAARKARGKHEQKTNV